MIQRKIEELGILRKLTHWGVIIMDVFLACGISPTLLLRLKLALRPIWMA